MQEQTKIDWMFNEMVGDGFEDVTKTTIEDILNGDTDGHSDAVVDYVLELESDWATEGNT